MLPGLGANATDSRGEDKSETNTLPATRSENEPGDKTGDDNSLKKTGPSSPIFFAFPAEFFLIERRPVE